MEAMMMQGVVQRTAQGEVDVRVVEAARVRRKRPGKECRQM
jgi:hypothetical protein